MALEPLQKVRTSWLWDPYRKYVLYGFGTFTESSNCRNFTFITRWKAQQENKIRNNWTGCKKNILNIKLIKNKIRQYGQREIIQRKVLKHYTKRKTPNSKTKIKIAIKVE
jgi:hypothetical protein